MFERIGVQHNSEHFSAHVFVVGLVCGLALVLTAFAMIVRPVYDDAWMVLLLDAGGNILENMQDRPILGACEQFLAERHLIWPVGLGLHWICWTGFGLIAMKCWELQFPGLPSFRFAAACLAVAPVICDYQLVVINSVGIMVSVLMGLSAVLLLERDQRTLSAWQAWGRSVAAAALIAGGVLICEYAIPAVAAMTVALGICSWRDCEPAGRAQRFRKLGLIAGTVVAAYVFYWSTGSSSRREVRPEVVLSESREARTQFRELARGGSAFWFAMCAATLKRTSQLEVVDSASAVSLAAGITLAGLACLSGRSARRQGAREDPSPPRRAVRRLVMGVVAGMLPVLVMRQRFSVDFGNNFGEGRYWLPVLPFVSCLTLYVLINVPRRRHQWLVLPLCGLLAGYYTADQGLRAIRKRQLLESWANPLESLIASDGFTVAVFDTPESPRYVPEYELTQRITRSWSPEKCDRFWAFPNYTLATYGISGLKWGCGASGLKIDRKLRGLKRQGPIGRLLWVHVEPSGSIDVLVGSGDGNNPARRIDSARPPSPMERHLVNLRLPIKEPSSPERQMIGE